MEEHRTLSELKSSVIRAAAGSRLYNEDFVLCKGIRTSYYEMGTGPVLVLLHGAFSNGLCWLPVLENLSDHFRIIVPDLPGHGCSDAPRTFYSRKFYTEWLQAFIFKLNLANVTICGNSLGGAVATGYALAHPGALRQVVLANAVGLLNGVPVRGNIAYIVRILKLALFPKRATPASTDRLWDVLLQNPGTFRSESWAGNTILFTLRAIQRKNGTRPFWFGQVDAIRPFKPEELRLIEVPVLLAWGEQDTIAPLNDAKGASSFIPRCTLEIIKNAGHVPFIDQPDKFCEALTEFILGRPVYYLSQTN